MAVTQGIRQVLFAGLAVALAFIAGAPAQAADNNIKVEDAWIPMAAPSIKVHAGYFTIKNGGDTAQELVAAECDSYEKAELHISRVTDGVATMDHVAQVAIPAHGDVKFAPGSLHVMLVGAKAPLAEGAKVELRLVFADGSKVPVSAVVKKGGDAGQKTN